MFFLIFIIVINARVNIDVQTFFEMVILTLLDVYLERELSEHMIILFLTFKNLLRCLFTFPSTVCKYSIFNMPLLIFNFYLFHNGYPNRCHCVINSYFLENPVILLIFMCCEK